MTQRAIVPCDFSTSKEHGFFWQRNHNSVASATLYHDGLLEFRGSNYRVVIENIGTPAEKVLSYYIGDLNDE
jgi:hypothetical protein